MFTILNRYSLIITVSLIFASLLVSSIVYNSQEYLIDPKDGSLKDTEVFGMLDGYVIEKTSLDNFDKKRYDINPDENADKIGNVSGVLGLGYTLALLGVISVLGMFIYNGIKDPKSIVGSIAFMGGLFLLYLVCRGLSSSVLPNGLTNVSVHDYKVAGGLLNMTYLLAVTAVISILVGGVLPLFRK